MDLTPIVSILGGVIASSSFIVSKKENAKELIDKLVPYQGWIGAVLLFWSLRNLLFGGFRINNLLLSGVQFVVGFILAYALLTQYLFSKNDEAKAKGQELRAKLAKYQVPAGLILLVLGILRLFNMF